MQSLVIDAIIENNHLLDAKCAQLNTYYCKKIGKPIRIIFYDASNYPKACDKFFYLARQHYTINEITSMITTKICKKPNEILMLHKNKKIKHQKNISIASLLNSSDRYLFLAITKPKKYSV